MGKVLAICQMGGEFIQNKDGTLTYSGGEAHAVDIERDMALDELRNEISGMFNCNMEAYSIKYFLPNNKKTAITVSNDKDLKRMVDFHANSDTTDIYIMKKAENRVIRSVVADSDTTTDMTTTILATVDGSSKRRRVSVDWANLITGVGQVFESPKAFRDTLHKYAVANKFTYKFVKNDTTRVTAECTAEDCPWRIHASKSPAKKEFMIKKMSDEHTCGKEMKRGHRLASQRWVASVIKEKLRDSPNYKPKDIATDLEKEYGLSLNYSQAWRGKFIAKKELYNSLEEASGQLPWFISRIHETNPGSIATMDAPEGSKCRFFVAFRASLEGFEHGCRPLLFLDAITSKSTRHWRLLVATAVDGEGEIFPVAFTVVENDSLENWRWFLEQLKSTLSSSRAITFVCNGQNGLLEEIPLVFEEYGYPGYCVNQLIEDFTAQLDEEWTQEVKNDMVDHLRHAIYALKAEEFNQCLDNIKAQSEEVYQWLMETKPERWSDAYFKGLRYGQYSSNAVEIFTDWVSTRYELSVVQMVDLVRCKIMEMMYTRRETSNGWTDLLTPSANRKVQEHMNRARTLDVVCSAGDVFEVRDDSVNNVVNVETWECSCRRWQVDGLPCMHALAVFERTDRGVYDYCSKYFTAECYRLAYSSSINPIPDVGQPIACSSELIHSSVTPPTRTRRMAGRPKEKPADPRISIKRSNRCSKCKVYGHNKATCKMPAQMDI
ncbi:MuDR family transposase [Rhynchospora pubera]|uniref:MuDR family transposase n=1 Tax=Rhynchospora pubera TaxID=906938 RepID=A0AAV8H3E3_9POAL|nr:MuDR family transposase [Rhynchospora pubera]